MLWLLLVFARPLKHLVRRPENGPGRHRGRLGRGPRTRTRLAGIAALTLLIASLISGHAGADDTAPANVTSDVPAMAKAGQAALDAGDRTQADGLAQSALAAAKTPRDRLRVGALFAEAGMAHRFARELAPALADLQVALPIVDAADKPELSANILTNLGAVYEGLHRPSDALAADQRAQAIDHRLGLRSAEATDLYQLGQANEELGHHDAALSAEQSALALFAALGDAEGQGMALAVSGSVETAQGDPQAALDVERKAIALVHASGASQVEAALLSEEVISFDLLHRPADERDANLRLLAIYEKLDDRDGQRRVLFALGVIDNNLYDEPASAAAFERAVALERARGDRKRLAFCLLSLGGVYDRMYRYDEALRVENEALRIETELQSPEFETMVLNEIGLINADRADYPAALAAYEKALAFVNASGNALGQADAFNNIGNIYEDQGSHGKAIAALQQALAAAQRANNLGSEAVSRLDLGLAYGSAGRNDLALGLYRQALADYGKLADRRGEATVLANMGAADARLGRSTEALRVLDMSRSMAAQSGDVRVQAATLGNIAFIEDRLGRYDSALADDQNALATERTINDRRKEATTLRNIALLKEELGDNQSAEELELQALGLDRAIGDQVGAAGDLGALSTVYRRKKEYAQSVAAAREELARMHERRDASGELAAFVSLGTTDFAQNNCGAALAAFTSAQAIARRIGDQQGEGAMLVALSQADGCVGRWNDARANAEQGASLARRLSNPNALAPALFDMAVADAKAGRRAPAIREADEALRTIDGLRPQFASTTDRAAFFGGGVVSDFDLYTDYLATLDSRSPNNGYDRKAFDVFERRQVWAVLDEFGSTAARRYAGVPEDISSDDRSLTRQVAEDRENLAKLRLAPKLDRDQIAAGAAQLAAATRRLAQLQRTIAVRYPRYYQLEHPRSVDIGTLQRTVLRSDEVLLAYDVQPTAAVLWVVDRTHFSMVRLAHPERIAPNVAALRQALANDVTGTQTTRRAVTRAGYALYAGLLPAPIRPVVARAKDLIVIPSGPLYALPWEVLVTRDPGTADAAPHFLIEDHAVSYVPSAALLALTRATGHQTRHAAKPLVAFADPDFSEPAAPAAPNTATAADTAATVDAGPHIELVGGKSASIATPAAASYPPLTGSRREVEAVRAALDAPAADIHTGDDASLATVGNLDRSGALKEYRYVVFATHAEVPHDGSSDEPALILAHPSRDRILTLTGVLGLTLAADFVMLSACNTGGGTHAAGEGISGLTRAFLYAGAPAISVTLWEAADEVGPLLSPAFFRAMHAGATPAEALRTAKLTLIHGSDSKLRPPYFWAPTVIFGDGGGPTI